MQQNSKYRFCDDKDEMINHIRECSNLVQNEYKTRQELGGEEDSLGIVQEIEILPNGICTNQNLSKRMRCIKPSRILRYKRITKSQPKDQTNKKRELVI